MFRELKVGIKHRSKSPLAALPHPSRLQALLATTHAYPLSVSVCRHFLAYLAYIAYIAYIALILAVSPLAAKPFTAQVQLFLCGMPSPKMH